MESFNLKAFEKDISEVMRKHGVERIRLGYSSDWEPRIEIWDVGGFPLAYVYELRRVD